MNHLTTIAGFLGFLSLLTLTAATLAACCTLAAAGTPGGWNPDQVFLCAFGILEFAAIANAAFALFGELSK
jgi:hypothetical protein